MLPGVRLAAVRTGPLPHGTARQCNSLAALRVNGGLRQHQPLLYFESKRLRVVQIHKKFALEPASLEIFKPHLIGVQQSSLTLFRLICSNALKMYFYGPYIYLSIYSTMWYDIASLFSFFLAFAIKEHTSHVHERASVYSHTSRLFTTARGA